MPPRKLWNPVTVSASAVRLGNYMVGSGKRLDGFELLVANTGSSEVGLDLWLGSAAADASRLFDRRTLRLPGQSSLVISSRQVLYVGDSLWAAASSAGALTIHGSGVETLDSAPPRKLWTSVAVGVGGATRYTVPGGRVLLNPEIAVCNRGSAAVDFSGWLVPRGGSAAASNYFARAVPVQPGETRTFSLRQVLAEGDAVRLLASAGSSLTAHGSGYEMEA